MAKTHPTLHKDSYDILLIVKDGFITTQDIRKEAHRRYGIDPTQRSIVEARLRTLQERGLVQRADVWVITEKGLSLIKACEEAGGYDVLLERLPNGMFEILRILVESGEWMTRAQMYEVADTSLSIDHGVMQKLEHQQMLEIVYRPPEGDGAPSTGYKFRIRDKGRLAYNRELSRRHIIQHL